MTLEIMIYAGQLPDTYEAAYAAPLTARQSDGLAMGYGASRPSQFCH